MKDDRQLVIVDGRAGYDLGLTEGAVRVTRFGETARLVPIRRIDRVIVRSPQAASMQALLALVRHGATVHFQDGHGHIAAVLTPCDIHPAPQWQSLVHLLRQRIRQGNYAEWLHTQLRHELSRVLHRAPSGRISVVEHRIEQYAALPVRPSQFRKLWRELRALLWAWLDSTLQREGLGRIADEVTLQGFHWVHDLERCLRIPTLWALAPWLRMHPRHTAAERVEFFESIRDALYDSLILHLGALAWHLTHGPATLNPCREDHDDG